MNARDQTRQTFVTCVSISLPHELVCSQTIKYEVFWIRSKYWHFRTICEQTVDILPLIQFLPLSWWLSTHRVATLFDVATSVHAFLCMTYYFMFGIRFSPWLVSGNFSAAPEQTSGNYPHCPSWSDILFRMQTKINMVQEMMLVLPNQHLLLFSKSDRCSVSFQPVWYRPHTQIRIVLFR